MEFSRDCKDNESTPPKMSQLGQFRRSKSSSILELFRDCKDNESTPPKMPELGQFRRAKSFSILELFKDCKDKENTPPKMPNTPPRTLKYSSSSHSPLSDQSESPLTSPLKRMAESPITHYFKRVDISKTVIKSTPTSSTPKNSGDAESSDDEYDDDIVIKSTPCNNSKKNSSTVSISDESITLVSPSSKLSTLKKVTVSATVGRRVSKSHVTPPTKSGINGYFHKMKGKHKKVSRYITEDKLRDVSPEIRKEKVASVGFRHVSKSHVTPPTKIGINGYFHKMKGKHKKVSRYITEDKLHDVSPETLRVFAAARGGDNSLLQEYTMENPFI